MIIIVYEIIGFVCGYMLILMAPDTSPFHIGEFLMSFIINPFLFFFMMVFFLVGFVSHSILFKGLVESAFKFSKGQRLSSSQLLVYISVLAGYFFLFILGPLQASLLLAFSVIYGIISVDLKTKKVFDIDR
ncbi:hypothetical protein [Fredinandcohnia sp. 179-A 10B2 NHS]|uniref:hypothetical protein n=1 Tax=Fredinandcohnia sp. 179-A 10B2 NHS TaxID=3235176 RepID=UPI0039A04459